MTRLFLVTFYSGGELYSKAIEAKIILEAIHKTNEIFRPDRIVSVSEYAIGSLKF